MKKFKLISLVISLMLLMNLSLAGQNYHIDKIVTATWNVELSTWNDYQEEDFTGIISFNDEGFEVKTQNQTLTYIIVTSAGNETLSNDDCRHYYYGTDAEGNRYVFELSHAIEGKFNYMIVVTPTLVTKYILGDIIRTVIT